MSVVRVNQVQDTSTNVAANISGGVVTFTNPPINVGVSNLQIFNLTSDVALNTSIATLTNYNDGHNTQDFKRIGTAWSVSNGVFTPSVSGLYEITFVASYKATTSNRYLEINFNFSTDSGSNFASQDMYTSLTHTSSTSFTQTNFSRYYNITNASNTRFYVAASAASSATLRGASNLISYVIFKRLADAQ